MLLWSAPMTTEKVHTMVAPQPPRLRTEPPSAVSRKLGLARATTKPSNQLIALISSRSSTEATAMTASLVSGYRECVCNRSERSPSRVWTPDPHESARCGTSHVCALLCSAGGRPPREPGLTRPRGGAAHLLREART